VSGSAATLLYDGDCGVCRWCVAVLLVKDRHRRLRPVALQDPRAVALLPGMDAATRMASWHLVAPDGTAWSAGAALAPALRLLPGGGPAASVAERFPGAVDRGYRLVVRHRGRLGRLLPTRSRAWADRRLRRRIAG
jgi:predicted DCC family thiol-disulfide oxidoreductase YuxK